jgi:restriction system protein
MSIPDFQSIMLPLLKYLGDKKEKSNQEITQDLAKFYNLSSEEINRLLPSGNQQIFANRVAWAKSYLKQSLLIISPRRGHYQITSNGLKVLRANPGRIDIKFLTQFPEFANFRGKGKKAEQSGNDEQPESKTPEEYIEFGFQKIIEDLSRDLLGKVKECPPKFFERLVIDLLLAMGYGGSRQEAGKVIGTSGDGGIDGIINEDKLGLDSIYVQAKRWEGTVGRPEIQRFAGALQGKRARKGVFITTSSFTKDAFDYVSRIDSKIILIDGENLANLMIEHNIGTAKVSSYDIKKIDSDYFVDE